MKMLKAVLLLLLFLPSIWSCTAKFAIPENAIIGKNFIGKWEGQHSDKKSGILRKWDQTRNSDGTYSIHLKYYDKENKYLKDTVETGYWWIQDNLFYEISPGNMKTPESYQFKFINKDKIKFSSVITDSSSKQAGYSFVDTRVSE